MMSSTSLLFNHSFALFKRECRLNAEQLRQGKCQLCIDGLLLYVSSSSSSNDQSENANQITTPLNSSNRCPLIKFGDEFLISIIKQCPNIKIIYPPNKSFRGLIDVSLFESCHSLELVRIPFNKLIGTEILRQNLHSLIWIRGNYESFTESTYSLWQSFRQNENINSKNENFKPIRIDESFWNEFGQWSALTYLCISRSNINVINASKLPNSIKTLDLRLNRICQFKYLNDNFFTNSLTKLCLDYNSLKELPKLNTNKLSSLIYLSLRGNLIQSIFGLRNYSSLKYLDISENSITNIRKFLSELVFLSPTLKTLWVEKNPICNDRWLKSKCQSVLYQLTCFNGKLITKNITQSNEILQPLPIISNIVDQTIRLSNDSNNNNIINEQSSSNSERKAIKSKPSKERFVIIGDDDNSDLSPLISQSPATKAKHLNKETPVKNYFFGGYTGSYGSMPNRNESESKLFEVYAEKDELSVQIDDNSNDKQINIDENESNQQSVHSNETCILNITAATSEWADEDTEEDTVFLVEIYQSVSEFEAILATPDPDVDYYFIRIRPRDGLIYEKDCTSGKILQTFDLKVLEKYECLKEQAAVKLYFDSCVVSKKERIYRFLDHKSYLNFVNEFLSKIMDYRKQYETSLGENDRIGLLKSNQNANSNESTKNDAPWFYMCLRCGNRTHRIITDCPKCNSDLIIKDESSSNNTDNNKDALLQKTITSSIDETESKIRSSSFSFSDNNDLDDLLKLDENFFRHNIDHYLKLHIEIYLYEKIDDESLKNESVEVLFYCQRFDFQLNTFRPALAILTANYFFIFDHLENQTSSLSSSPSNQKSNKNSLSTSFKSMNEEKQTDLINLIFYVPLASKKMQSSSSLHIYHLPISIKNIGYWIEYKMNNLQRKLLSKLNNNKRLSNNRQQQLLELIIFGDNNVGKAFLELLFEFQKICLRKNNYLGNLDNKNELIKVRNKLIDIDNIEYFRVKFDEKFSSLLFTSSQNESNAIITNPFEQEHRKIDEIFMLNDHSYKIFILKFFQLLQNNNNNNNSTNNVNGSTLFNNVFELSENIGLFLLDDNLIIFEIYSSLKKISSIINNDRKKSSSSTNEQLSIIKLLKEKYDNNFDDYFEMKTLFKESIINLLPNIYIDKNHLSLTMRFRDDDLCNDESIRLSLSSSSTSNHRFNIYEYRLKFLDQQSLIQTCRLICSIWETNFGVSLTISKHRQ